MCKIRRERLCKCECECSWIVCVCAGGSVFLWVRLFDSV